MILTVFLLYRVLGNSPRVTWELLGYLHACGVENAIAKTRLKEVGRFETQRGTFVMLVDAQDRKYSLEPLPEVLCPVAYSAPDGCPL